MEAARLVIGYGVLAKTTAKPGFSVGLDDQGLISESAGGQWIEQKGARADVMQVNWSPVESDLAHAITIGGGSALLNRGNFLEARHALGATSECVLIPRLTSPLWIKRTAIHGHLQSPLEIEHIEGSNEQYSVRATVVEEF